MNYQYSYDATAGRKIYKYETVGNWKDNVLLINKAIRWPEHKMLGNIPIKSICSRLCNLDQIRIFNQKKRCCWSCRSCSKTQYINKSAGFDEKCVKCPKGFLATSKKTECKEIDPSFTHWEDVGSIMAIIFSCIGLIITIAIMAILAKFHNTPVVKSSTRELMYAILVGIALSYLTIFPLLHKPTVLSCYLTRIMPGLSFSLIFGSLVTKTNRIFRILAISKKKIIYRKGRFLTTTAQIVIVFLLNVIEIAIISAMIWQQPPNPIKLYISNDKVYLICNTPSSSLMISMGFDAILIAFCTWYAFKTRNLPENFNEAKFIGFTMYTTCIIWIGLVVIYLSTDLQVISLCFAIDLTATICIILLFLPKVYIILFRPEKNERSAFTTTTEIQCHIGSGSNNQNLKKNSKVLPKIQQATDSPNYSHTNLNNLDEDFLSLKSSFNNLPLIEGLIKPAVGKENKIIQTDSSLIEEVVHNSLSICKEENFVLISQMISCFDSLKFDWSKIFIPHRLNIELTNGMHSVTEITPVKFMDEN
uniref:GCR154 n=1 Tax=Schmidtea mediterranea TaxID=79327 RepID=A0A193KUP1_SCHMD|nr:GCR154 [Schmidtea mediterranea]